MKKVLLLAVALLCAVAQERSINAKKDVENPLQGVFNGGTATAEQIASSISDSISEPNRVKIENKSDVAIKLTTSYKSCKTDVAFLNPGEETKVLPEGCQIYAIKADGIVLPGQDGTVKQPFSFAKNIGGGLSEGTVFYELRNMKGHQYKKTYHFKGPDENGNFSFEKVG